MSDKRTIADLADELTNPIRVREQYTVWQNRNRKVRYWEHTMPSVLDQLAAAVIPGEVVLEGGGGTRSPRSVPAARIEAVSAMLQIDAAAATWALETGCTVRGNTASNIRALVGAQTTSDINDQIRRDMRRWYGWAATLSGWERMFKPDAPCPACDLKGYLRVNLTRQTATCALGDKDPTGCGETWEQDTIGILAAHIEAQSTRKHWDTSVLRTAAVIARREAERIRFDTETKRPTALSGVLLDQA